MNYFANPNLPNKRSKSVLIDYRTSEETVNELNNLGIKIFKTQPVKSLYNAVQGHADMQIHHLGNDRFVTAPEVYEYYKSILLNADIIKGSKELISKYPEDICYNAAAFGNYLICNAACTALEILSEYQSMKQTILNVKQGYAKCSVCVVNESAIITSDKSIAKTAMQHGIDVLHIESGYIKLKDMSYGFIGGATGLLAPDILAVNGDIKTHINYNDIISFCRNYNIYVTSLKNGEIEDIGSIIPLF